MLPVGRLPVLRDYGEVRRSLQAVGGKDNGRQVRGDERCWIEL